MRQKNSIISHGGGRVGFWKPKEDIRSVQRNEDPLFGGGGCCDGVNQIFWYVPMGGEGNFGIHMNAEEFETWGRGQSPEFKKDAFQNGMMHEYFHHIVDSWCVINEINQEKLRKKYGKEVRKEKYLLVLEEPMGEYMAHKCTGSTAGFSQRGIYSLWRPFTSRDVWLEGSLIVALQYIEGAYEIDGATPPKGFTENNLNQFKVPIKWKEKVSGCKIFPIEGDELGFKTDPEAGVWHFEVIPFHIHNETNITTDYKAWKTEFSDSLDEEE
jgi:hypothetical protein